MRSLSCAIFFVAVPALAQSVDVRTVVVLPAQPEGLDEPLTSVDLPAVGPAGHVVFRGIAPGGVAGLWMVGPERPDITLVALGGSSVGGTMIVGVSTFSGFDGDPTGDALTSINASGDVAFIGSLNTGDHAVVVHRGGALEVAVTDSDVSGGVGTVAFLNAQGRVAIDNGTNVYVETATGLTRVIGIDDASPLDGFVLETDLVGWFDDGTASIAVRTTTSPGFTRQLLYWDGAALLVASAAVDELTLASEPSGTVFVRADDPETSDVPNELMLVGPASGPGQLYVREAGNARETLASVTSIGTLIGDVFDGLFPDDRSGIGEIGFGGAVTWIAERGTPAPDGGSFETVSAVVAPNGTTAVIESSSGTKLYAPTPLGDGLALAAAQGAALLVAPDDAREISFLHSIPNPREAGRGRNINNLGHVAFGATFVDGSKGIFVANQTPTAPEPLADLVVTMEAALDDRQAAIAIRAANDGPDEIFDLTFALAIPAGARLAPDADARCSQAGETITCTSLRGGGLDPLESDDFDVSFDVVDLPFGEHVLEVTASSSTRDPEPDDNVASVTIEVAVETALEVALAASDLTQNRWTTTITATNTGTEALRDVEIVLDIDAEKPVLVRSTSRPCDIGGQVAVTCAVGELADGDSVAIDVVQGFDGSDRVDELRLATVASGTGAESGDIATAEDSLDLTLPPPIACSSAHASAGVPLASIALLAVMLIGVTRRRA